MKNMKQHLIASLVLLSSTVSFSQDRVELVKTYKNVITQTFDLTDLSKWAFIGSARLPVHILGLIVTGKYEKSPLENVEVSYLQNTKELRLLISEQKSGSIESATVACKNGERFHYEFAQEFEFSAAKIRKEKESGKTYGAGCSIPLSGLENCEIDFVDIEGHTVGLDAARVRVEFFVPKKDLAIDL